MQVSFLEMNKLLPKLSNRLLYVQKLLKKNEVIADVGCDHCYTSIYAILKKHVSFCYNIDISKKALESGIDNLMKYNILSKTKNIVSNGLTSNEITKTIDKCIITGMGGNTAADIINKKSNDINVKEFILVLNNKQESFRRKLNGNFYKIKQERIIKCSNFYFAFIIVLPGKQKLTQEEITFGKNMVRDNTFKSFWKSQLLMLNKITKKDTKIINKIKLIKKSI